MEEREKRMLEILLNNKGFAHPERWIKYGLLHDFQRVHADELQECPDCGCSSLVVVGQYVYYSTLVNLRECVKCGLVFSDKRIDSKLVRLHFERAYKDETYFRISRRRIFEQISALADSAAVYGGSVLDIGGAKGHLLATLQRRRSTKRECSEVRCGHHE
jgi:Zn ribbon nucleic-acid-binding protein